MVKPWFSRARALKSNEQINEKSMPISSSKKKVPKSHRNRFWEGLGLHLGRVWGALGHLLGAFGRFLGVFGAFKIKLFSSIGPKWALRGLLDRFGVIWGGIWEDFGRIWPGFGKDFDVLDKSWADLGNALLDLALTRRFGICLAWFGLAAAGLLNWTPALIREASQFLLRTTWYFFPFLFHVDV